ncbi:MAG TPA: hypothetical protein VNA25_16560, partial [Phycisphaerae bacterium]|nr:hypothetical protein [Phycisphaerae bacterium]
MRKATILAILVLGMFGAQAFAADSVELSIASTRQHYTVAEPIELALLYKNDGGNAKAITLELVHADGSSVAVPVSVAAPAGNAKSVMVTVPPFTLKPGDYAATALAEGAGKDAQVTPVKFSVFQAEHANAFPIGQWVHHGDSGATTLSKGGWMYMTTDLATLAPRKPTPDDPASSYVAARSKPFQRMVLGGGHQLDLVLENDWGDPWVQRAVVWRMQLAALSNRMYPMAGLHCYDEPGLTWWNGSPYIIPHQLEEFKKLTGKDMPAGPGAEVLSQYAKMMDDWIAFLDMRMKYLEQCWYGTVWGTKCVRPDFITINQVSSSYAPSDTTDGVDSRQARPYDVVCGHGGYSDQPFGKFTPVRSCEAMWGWTWDKPHYYLPMWYTHDWASMRNEVWMSLSTKLDGLLYTPEQDFGMNNDKAPGFNGSNTILEIAEINRRVALIGDVMRQLKKSLSPVAVLHSHRQMAWDIATVNADGPAAGAPFYASPHREAVDQCFFRTMETGIVPNYTDEGEAEVKGAAFLKQWKVIYCPRLAYAAPAFRKALEGYIAAGGKLVQCKDDKLKLAGATVVDHSFVDMTAYYNQNKDNRAAYVDLVLRKRVGALAPNFAQELAGWLGEQPYSLSNKQMILGVHKAGPAAYLFIANNAQSEPNPRAAKWELVPAETTVKIPAGGVVYDLLNGGEIPFK